MRFGRTELTIPLSQAKFRSRTPQGRKTQGTNWILRKKMSFWHFVQKSLADYCPHTKSCVGTIYRPQRRNRPKLKNRRIWFFPSNVHPLWVPELNFRENDAHIVFFDIFSFFFAKFSEFLKKKSPIFFFGRKIILLVIVWNGVCRSFGPCGVDFGG